MRRLSGLRVNVEKGESRPVVPEGLNDEVEVPVRLSDKESEPFHIKYRPQSFDGFIGNEGTVEALKRLVESDSCPRAFLFVGPSGCGKTTLARILANELGASGMNLVELNVADLRGIDAVRNVIEGARYTPLVGRRKVFILDEAHKLTNDAQNALLKDLEEPPPHTVYILCSTDPHKLLKTIRSRCSVFQVRLLNREELTGLAERVVENEGLDIPSNIIRKAITLAGGAPRELLVLLNKLAGAQSPEEMGEILEFGTLNVADSPELADLAKALISKRFNNKERWETARAILKETSLDSESIRQFLLAYLGKVLLNKPLGEGSASRIALLLDLIGDCYGKGMGGIVAAIYAYCNQ